MLEELFNLVKSVATEGSGNTPEVPQEHNDAVVAEATNTVASVCAISLRTAVHKTFCHWSVVAAILSNRAVVY